jgi:acyl-CoA reductase-like NAD-dependent aldehyde dehydrogenase
MVESATPTLITASIMNPALFTHVAEDSELWHKEVFGPVLLIDTFADEARRNPQGEPY